MAASTITQHLRARVWHSPALNTWASLATRSLSVVLVLPLVLRQFRPEEIALWQVFSTLISMQMLADLGFGITGARVLAYALGGATNLADAVAPTSEYSKQEANWPLLSQVLATLRVIYLRLGWLLAVLLTLGGTWALLRPVSQLTLAPTNLLSVMTSTTHAWMAWVVILITTVVTFRANLYSAFLQGVNEVALLRRWETWFGLAAIGSSFLVLSLRGGLLALVLSNQLWALASAWRNHWLARRVLQGRFARFPAPKYHREVFAAIWPRAWRSAIGAFMSQGLMHLSGLLYAQHRDSGAVATYLLGLRLTQTLTQISQAPFNSKLPAMARLYAEGRNSTLVALARRGMTLAYWGFALPFVIVGLSGAWLVQQFGSQVSFPSSTLWALLGLAAFVERHGAMHLQLYSTTNHIIWHIANGVTGLIFVVTALLAYPHLGVLALPLGMLAGNVLFYCGYSAAHSYRRFKLPFPQFELETIAAPLLIIIFAWLTRVAW